MPSVCTCAVLCLCICGCAVVCRWVWTCVHTCIYKGKCVCVYMCVQGHCIHLSMCFCMRTCAHEVDMVCVHMSHDISVCTGVRTSMQIHLGVRACLDMCACVCVLRTARGLDPLVCACVHVPVCAQVSACRELGYAGLVGSMLQERI